MLLALPARENGFDLREAPIRQIEAGHRGWAWQSGVAARREQHRVAGYFDHETGTSCNGVASDLGLQIDCRLLDAADLRRGLLQLCPSDLFRLQGPLGLLLGHSFGLERAVTLQLGLALGTCRANCLPGADCCREHQKGRKCGGRDQPRPVFSGELPQPISGRWRTSLHRIAGEVPLDVAGQARWPCRSAARGLSRAPSSRSSRARRAPGAPAAPAPSSAAPRSWPDDSFDSLKRVLGLGVSSSRMRRRIST